MENTSVLIAAEIGLAALLAFCGGIMMSKALRSEKVQDGESRKMSKEVLLTVSVVMLAAGLIFGSVLVWQTVRSDGTAKTLEMPIETSSVTAPATEALITEPTTEDPAAEPTTGASFTEPTTEPELLPIEEVILEGKGNRGGFYIYGFSDGTEVAAGIIEKDGEFITSYDTYYGSHETVIVPEVLEDGCRVRGAELRNWQGMSCIHVTEGMAFLEWGDKGPFETTLEEAQSYFAGRGITLENYDPDAGQEN